MTKLDATKLTEEQYLSIWREGGFDTENGEDWIEVDTAEEGAWEDEGKFSSSYIVFEYEGKFYRFEICRHGTYFSGYDFEVYDGATEVKKQTKTITVDTWVAV